MRSLWDEAARHEIAERVRKLTPDNTRQWGRMTPHQMLCHTADQLRMAVGDIATGPARGPLALAPVRYLIIVLPWLKGRAQAPPEAFTTSPAEWDADCQELLQVVERFGRTPKDQLAPTNPVFGRLSARDWGVLDQRQLDLPADDN